MILARTTTRLPRLVAALAAIGVCLAVSAGTCAGASAAEPGPLAVEPFLPDIVGGQEALIEHSPWQVFLLTAIAHGGAVEEFACGGAILSPTVVLTAAHCVDQEGTTTHLPIEGMNVIAGASDVAEAAESLLVPTGSQASPVASLRTHPYYSLTPIHDDVAVLTLATPLDLSGPDAKAISLVPTGATPSAGTPLNLTGYGKENGAESALPTWKLNSTQLSAYGSDPCRSTVGGESAVLLCAVSATSSACQGDSGGPLTEGSPPIEVGIVDYGQVGCPIGQPNAFGNVAAPEVRDFIEGSETPPLAARQTSPAAISGFALASAPVVYSPETCEPGGWSGAPSFTYTFQSEATTPQVFQSGSSNVFTPPASAAGSRIVCIIQASNAGGVTTARSGVTPPLAADTGQPQAEIGGVSCHLQTCSLLVAARDPASIALTVHGTAIYLATTKCPVNKSAKRGHARKQKKAVCQKAVNTSVEATAAAAGVYRATISGLPYGQLVIFRAIVTNAAGLRPTSAPIAVRTLRAPRPRPMRPHSKGKSPKGHARHTGTHKH